MKKVITMLLAMLMLLQTVACAESSSNPEETTAPAAVDTPVTEAVEEETEPVISDDLPESDFEGYEFMIFNSNPESNTWFTTVHVDVDEDSGEAIPSAIFNRNIKVEERLNVKISETEQTADQIKNTILAGDGAFDMSLMQGANILAHAQSGYLMDLHTMPYQNFEKPYWDANAVEQLSLGNKLFVMVGDFMTTQIDETICMFFNKDLIADHNLDNPYELVDNGTWTLDKLAEMASTTGNDANGDGVYDDKDNYGMMSWRGVFYMFLLNGCGNTLIEKDEADVPVFTFYDEKFVNSYEKILSIIHGEQKIYFDAEKDVNNHRVQEIMFPANQVLFWSECISWAKALREMEANFGILPAPKFDEAQTQYYSCNNGNFFGMSVPVSVTDIDRTSIIIEALQSASTDTVLAAYYDITLKSKYSRDEESSKMVDIIFDTTTYDCSTVYGLGSVKTNIYTMASENNKDLASFYNKQKKALGKVIEKMMDKLNELD
ncbi:MAG: extracellular solute-binding protein [Ruminococcaceae bacterium]|nr:extracellular solute-binding protein [Oscillospiraceae bacterium]